MFKHKYICTVVLLIFALAIAIENTHNLSNDISNSDAIITPKLLNYQGKLTNLAGNVVTDSTYSITFRLFTGLSGGSSFWSETQNVQTSQGLFNVLLGSSTVIDTIPQSGNCYLEMQVNPNPAMTPRIRLVSSAYAYLAKKSDTANYALTANIQYVDSTRVSTNSHKLQGKDTVALSNKYVDEGQTNAITNPMITDNAVTSAKIQDGTIQLSDLAFTPATRPLTPGVSNAEILDGAVTSGKILNNTILREDVATSFKAPYADTSDYTRNISIVYVDSSRIAVNAYNAYQLQSKDTIALSAKFVDEGQASSISSGMIIDATIQRVDVSSIFKAPYADTSDYVRNVNVSYVDSSRISDNSHKLQGKDTSALDLRYVNEGQANSISSTMIIDGTITNTDISATAGINDTKISGSGTLITNLNADYLDGQHASAFALSGHAHTYVDSARIATNAYKLQGKDTIALSAKFVDEGQSAGGDLTGTYPNPSITNNAVTTGKILNGTILREDVATDFKAPYADTSDYTRNISIVYVDSSGIAVNAYNAYQLQGKDTIALSAKFVDEGQSAGGDLIGTYPNPSITGNAITTAKILNNTILREDVAATFKAPYADTSDYVRNINIIYVDSARISINAHNAYQLQGKDTIALSAKFVDEGQLNSVTSSMITDGTITRNDVTPTFKAPFSDTADYARSTPPVGIIDSARVALNAYNAYQLQGKDTVALSNKFVDEGQTNAITNTMITDNAVTSAKIQDGTIQTIDLAFTPATRPLSPGISNTEILDGAVTSGKILNNTILREDVATSFKAPYADTSDYTRNISITYVDSARISANAHKLQGQDTLALSNKFVDEGQLNSITSTMITDGTITRNDVEINFKAPFSDTADYARSTPPVGIIDSARIALDAYNAYQLQGKDTIALSAKFIDEGQIAGGDLSNTYPNPTITGNAVTTGKILNNTILREDVAAAFKAPYADTADYVRNLNVNYVDSARISANSHQLQGKDTSALDLRYVNEGQANSISSTMIIDGTITNADISTTAGISDTKLSGTGTLITNLNADLLDDQHASAFALTGHSHTYTDSARISTNAHKLQGKDTIALSDKFIDEGQVNAITNSMITGNAVTTDKISNNTILREDVVTTFKSPYADTADYVRNLNVNYVDSARISTNTHKLQGKDTSDLDSRYINEGQTNSISSTMIIANAITRNNVTLTFKAPFSDTADYARSTPPVGIIDSARIALDAYNAYKLQGKDTIALSNKFVDEGQASSISSTMITDGTIINSDISASAGISDSKLAGTGTLITNLNADYLDGQHASAFIGTSADYGRSGVATDLYEGATTLTNKYINEGQSANGDLTGTYPNPSITGNAITTAKILNNTILREDVAAAFKAPYADTSDYVRNFSVIYVDSAGVSTNSHKLQGQDTLALSNKFVDEGQSSSISSTMIIDGTVTNTDISATAGINDTKISGSGTLITNFNADYLDGQNASAFIGTNADYGRSGVATDLYEGTTTLTDKYVNEGQVASGDLNGTYPNPTINNNAVTTAKIADGNVTMAKINQSGASTGQVLKWTGTTWAPRNDSIGTGVVSVSGSVPIVSSGGVNPNISLNVGNGLNTTGDNLNVIYGSTANTACQGNDARLSDARTPTGSAGGDLNGDYPNPAINNNAVTTTKIADGNVTMTKINQAGAITGQVLKWTGSSWEPKNDSIGGSLSGAAGGDLTGTYPNPSIATNAINSAKILDGSIRGDDIAKPCTLSASVASPGAILNIRNSGTGNGIRVNQGGIYVDTSSNDGIYISRAGDDGIQIDSCNQFGLWIKGCNRGVSVDNSASYGVYSNSNNQRGGYFRNNNNDYYALTAWNNTGTGGTVKGLYVQGNAYATGGFGTKMGDKSGFATISPNIEVILSGSSSLADGISIINFDQTVREAISEEIPLRVIVTPTSECKGIFVANKSATGFSVKELSSGRSSATFDWIAIGRIKGYEQTPYIVPVSTGEIELKPVNAERRHKENISENRDNRGIK